MRAIGIVGSSGSGKTTLIERLVPKLAERGLRVATVKHTHHSLAFGDSRSERLANAGSREVVLSGPTRYVQLVRETRTVELDEVLSRIDSSDLVLVEGFKAYPMPKIEVWRKATGSNPIFRNFPGVVALATDCISPGQPLPQLHVNDVEAIVQFILRGLVEPKDVSCNDSGPQDT